MPSPVSQHGLTHRPALDGARGFAVAAVLAYHGGLAFLPGGFFGVDAFFVLSGFLITSLLLAERSRTGRIRLPRFWARRARRLLPALLVMLAVVDVASHWLLPPGDLSMLRGDALAALLYVANWRMIFRGSDYFAQTATPSPLQHTWTLGIEEQFYLLWPLAVVALHARRRALLIVCAVGGAISTVLMWLLYSPTDASRAYFGTDTRAVALLAGCALAVLLAPRLADTGGRHRVPERRWHPVLGALTVVSVCWLAWAASHATGASRWQYYGGFTLVALAVAAVLAHAVLSPRSPTARVLSLWPIAALGRISYGVYLWHWPVFMFLSADRTGLGGLPLFAVRCAVTLAISVVSYQLIELPIRRGRIPRRGSKLAPAGVLAGMAAVAAVIVAATAVPGVQVGGPAHAAGKPVVVHQTSPSPSATAPMDRPGRKPGKYPRIDFYGDSVSWTLGTYLPPHPGLTVHVRSIEGCGIATLPDIEELGTPHTNYPGCTHWPRTWKKGVIHDDPDVSVILLDRWELMSRRLNGRYQHVGQPQFDAYLMGKLETAIHTVESRGAAVALLTAPYTHRAERPDGGLYGEDQPARADAWNRLLYQAAARDPHRIHVLDLNKVMCPDGHFTWTINGLQVRSDGLHFTPEAVQQIIAPWLLPKLARIAVAAPG